MSKPTYDQVYHALKLCQRAMLLGRPGSTICPEWDSAQSAIDAILPPLDQDAVFEEAYDNMNAEATRRHYEALDSMGIY